VTTLSALIEGARSIVVATPIYNYDANAAAKNLVTDRQRLGEQDGGVPLRGGRRVQLHVDHELANSLNARFSAA